MNPDEDTTLSNFTNLPQAATEFLKQVHITKGSRYNSHRRLLGKHTASQFALAVLSIYTIAASIATLVLPAATYPRLLPAMSAGTIVASVFVLVQSLLESAKNYQLRAHQMFRCAEKLSLLYNQCRAEINVGDFSIDDYLWAVSKYSEILSDYSENHSGLDYQLFLHTRKRNKPDHLNTISNTVHIVFLHALNFVHIWGSSALYISAPPVAVLIARFWLVL
jgi:SMODS and SLOG-associating 2TM effector domain family 5